MELPHCLQRKVLWLNTGAIFSVAKSAPFLFILALPCVAQAGSLRTRFLRFPVKRILGMILLMRGERQWWNLKGGKEAEAMSSFWLQWDYMWVWADVTYLQQPPGIFFWSIGFIDGGNGDHCHKFLAVSVPFCLLRELLRSSGSCSLSLFLISFNSLINTNSLYQILFYLLQVDREVSVGQIISIRGDDVNWKNSRPKNF